MKKLFATGLLVALMEVCTSCALSKEYRYTLEVHYIDGGSEIRTVDSYSDPVIKSHMGSYWLMYSHGYVDAVTRFKVLNKTQL